MRACPVVVIPPPTGDNPDFLKAVEDLTVEQFVSQARIEAFDIAVLPRAAVRDIEGGDAEPAQPFPHGIAG